MAERGVKIGAVQNPEALQGLVWVSGLKVLSPSTAKELHYQTQWPAIIPDLASRRLATLDEIDTFTTPRADSRVNPVFFRVNEQVVAELQAQCPEPGEPIRRKFKKGESPLLELAPGISAYLSVIRPDLPRPTTAWVNHEYTPALRDDPDFPHGASLGIHFDYGSGISVRTLQEVSRCAIICVGPDVPHYSLFVATNSVLDASAQFTQDTDYIPKQPELMPWLTERIADQKLVEVKMEPGVAVVLSPENTFHEGGTSLLGSAFTAVTYEPPSGWSEDALIANSLFK